MEYFSITDIKNKFDYEKIIAEQDKPLLYDGYTLTEEEFFASDGARLITYVSRPKGINKPLPVILRRTPYGLNSLRFFFEMSLYGYICVCQCCRGSFGSDGEFVPGINEKADTLDTIEWIKKMPDFDGNLAMCGASYLSMEQWQVGDCAPPELKTLYLEFYNPYRYIQLYTDGMFRLEAYAGWTSFNSGSKGSRELYSRAINHIPQITMDENVLGARLDWYRDWVSNPNPDAPIWHEIPWSHLEQMPERLNIPAMFHCGWYDPHLQGMLRAYDNIRPEIREKSVLIITPCNHKGTLSSDIPLENSFELTGRRFVKSKLAWFGHMLKGEPLPEIFTKGQANVYVIGENRWIKTDWIKAEAKERAFYLNTEKMSLERENKKGTPKKFIYNPLSPVPTTGSEVIMTDYMYNKNDSAHGIRQQKDNSHVLSFLSEPLAEDMTILGLNVSLDVSTTAEDTAFTAKLCIVKGEKAYHLREGITSLSFAHKNYQPNSIVKAEIGFFPIAASFSKGDRLRIDISSSSFPAYNAHANTKRLWSAEANPVCAEQTVYGGVVKFKTL